MGWGWGWGWGRGAGAAWMRLARARSRASSESMYEAKEPSQQKSTKFWPGLRLQGLGLEARRS